MGNRLSDVKLLLINDSGSLFEATARLGAKKPMLWV
jgi:hypothetical protein